MIGFIVLSLVGLGGAFVWGDKQLKTKALEMSDLLADKDIEQDKKVALEKSKNSVEDKAELENLISTLLPAKKDQEKLIVDVIYTATSEAGIRASQITSFSFSGSSQPDDLSGTEKSKDIPGINVYPFNMQLQNIPYATLLTFLKQTETNERIVQVSNVQITPDKASAGSLSAVSLSMKAYIKP